MKVDVKNLGTNTRILDIPFSIGDIVLIKDYGYRFAAQKEIFKNSKFLFGNIPFIHGIISNSDYYTCNNRFKNIEWKIVDVGFFNSSTGLILVILLKNRLNETVAFSGDNEGILSLKKIRNSKKPLDYCQIDVVKKD